MQFNAHSSTPKIKNKTISQHYQHVYVCCSLCAPVKHVACRDQDRATARCAHYSTHQGTKGAPESTCAPRKWKLIGRCELCRRSSGLILAVRCPEGGKGHDDKLSGYLSGERERRRGRGGQGVRPAGIYAGRQLGLGEAISGEDLSV